MEVVFIFFLLNNHSQWISNKKHVCFKQKATAEFYLLNKTLPKKTLE